MDKFTKGEWVLQKWESCDHVTIKNEKGVLIADVFGSSDKQRRSYSPTPDQAKAHADLFAASREMYEALIFCKSVIEKNGLFDVSDRMAFDKASAAIEKAEGIGGDNV